MYAALLADKAWLADELGTFRFLVVGLIDEQVRVAQVVPQCTAEDQASAFGARVSWRDSRYPFQRRRHLLHLDVELDALRITVLHALDGRLWDGALRLAHRLGVPLVLSVSSAQDLERIASLRRQIATCRVAFCAATAPLGDAVRQQVPDPSLVAVVPFGAHVATRTIQPPENTDLCILITGNGLYDSAYQALFESMERFVADHPSALLFFDGPGSDQHLLWQASRRYGLLAHTSMIPPHIGRRELLMSAHLLIQPQALERARSVTLTAMGCGLPVLARQDDWLDYLIDGQTAWLTDAADPRAWSDLIRRPIEGGAAARTLGESARQWVMKHHLAAALVERTIRLYRSLTGESYRFEDQ